MDEKNGTLENELQLFHGTKPDSVKAINVQGFNRSMCGINGKYTHSSVSVFSENTNQTERERVKVRVRMRVRVKVRQQVRASESERVQMWPKKLSRLLHTDKLKHSL